jgi:hypothetical protein
MKQTADMDRIQARMQPGVIARDGFLGEDTRRLADILDDDEAAVNRLGLDHARLAARLRELRDAGTRGLGEPIRVPPHYEVRVEGVRGKLPCPFGHEGVFPKTNTRVKNLETGREIMFTDLGLHMIEAHGFYEGRGSAFRLDPRHVADAVDLHA